MPLIPGPIKIIIADDHELVRIGFSTVLGKESDLQIVAEACNGRQLISMAGLYKPDIILTDIHMPEVNGIEATRAICREFPQTGVIGFSFCIEEHLIADMLEAGIRGYVLKHSHTSWLLAAIRAVSRGEESYCPAAAAIINRAIADKLYDPVNRERKHPLTFRETQVLQLICREKTSQDISAILGIGVRTVEDFRSKLHVKTGTVNIAGLVSYAVKQGIYSP